MRALNWPASREVYLTLDLECDFGTALRNNTFEAASYTDRLVTLLERLQIPLTIFVQTELLVANPAAVDRLIEAGFYTEFYPHSHTHQARTRTDMTAEIQRSTERFRSFFDQDPLGYRFPDGDIRDSDYDHLAAHGYRFDASVFPTVRLGKFNHTNEPTTPSYRAATDVVEIPFTTYPRALKIPTALSYCRLFGRPYTELLLRRPPPVVVFNIHMHDLFTPSTYRELSPLYKTVYARNDWGFELLETVLDRLLRAGLNFRSLSSVHDRIRADLAMD